MQCLFFAKILVKLRPNFAETEPNFAETEKIFQKLRKFTKTRKYEKNSKKLPKILKFLLYENQKFSALRAEICKTEPKIQKLSQNFAKTQKYESFKLY